MLHTRPCAQAAILSRARAQVRGARNRPVRRADVTAGPPQSDDSHRSISPGDRIGRPLEAAPVRELITQCWPAADLPLAARVGGTVREVRPRSRRSRAQSRHVRPSPTHRRRPSSSVGRAGLVERITHFGRRAATSAMRVSCPAFSRGNQVVGADDPPHSDVGKVTPASSYRHRRGGTIQAPVAAVSQISRRDNRQHPPPPRPGEAVLCRIDPPPHGIFGTGNIGVDVTKHPAHLVEPNRIPRWIGRTRPVAVRTTRPAEQRGKLQARWVPVNAAAAKTAEESTRK